MFAIGSISHGTLRQQDLLRSFSEAYEQNREERFESELRKTALRFADYLDEHDQIPEKVSDQISDVLADLLYQLDIIASEHGCYFGATEGDGSDFGFWQLPETEEEDEYGESDDPFVRMPDEI